MVERYADLAAYFVHNVEALRDAYGREEGMLYPVCAAILLERERPITAAERYPSNDEWPLFCL